jgi:subtilisin family serine protease
MALPDWIYGQASPISLGGRSLFNTAKKVRPSNVVSFSSHPTVTRTAKNRLEDSGFEILQVTPYAINWAASPDTIERAARTKLVEKEYDRPNGGTATFIDSPDTDMLGYVSTVGTPLADMIEGMALEVPRDLMAEAAQPPLVNYAHLTVPDDVADAANASPLHRLGITGAGVKVAMVDSGWYRHAFFTANNYRVQPVTVAPGASEPDHDESGHGTGESANIFAIAPDCVLYPVKANFANTIAAFNAAVDLNPDIITCSWGTHSPFFLSAADMVLEASVAAAVARGIIVIFSAGNGHAGFPGQHPDVISAGGVLMHPDGFLEASNYSTGFTSMIFPGRRVPDVCGLVGSRPRAIYIMLPVEPGDQIDVDHSGAFFPDGDETLFDDGWAAFSGTSAAAPQLAGAAALIKQVVPAITPAAVKDVLVTTARDVVDGFCAAVPDIHGGLPAAPGVDDATGPGLVDVFSAVVEAYTRSMSGTVSTTSATDEAALQTAAYLRGVADAATAGAALYDDPALTAYLREVADATEALSTLYWTAASS